MPTTSVPGFAPPIPITDIRTRTFDDVLGVDTDVQGAGAEVASVLGVDIPANSLVFLYTDGRFQNNAAASRIVSGGIDTTSTPGGAFSLLGADTNGWVQIAFGGGAIRASIGVKVFRVTQTAEFDFRLSFNTNGAGEILALANDTGLGILIFDGG